MDEENFPKPELTMFFYMGWNNSTIRRCYEYVPVHRKIIGYHTQNIDTVVFLRTDKIHMGIKAWYPSRR